MMIPGALPIDDGSAQPFKLPRRVLPAVTASADAASDDDEQIRRWLDSLRDGSEMDKIAARRGLAGVFERRGMLEEAIELLELNVDAGVRGAETLRSLSRLYQAQGGSEPAGHVEVRALSKRPRGINRPIAFLVAIVGLGIALGVVLWMVMPVPVP